MPHEPQDHALGLSRRGFGSKLHVMTDGCGNILQVIITRGNRNECPVLGPLLASTIRNCGGRRPKRLAGDKGFSADRIRDGLVAGGIQPLIPMRDTEHVKDRADCEKRWGVFDKVAYKARNVVERAIAKLKEFRRIATRYEKLAESHVGMINVACIVLDLRQLS
jgi:transposase